MSKKIMKIYRLVGIGLLYFYSNAYGQIDKTQLENTGKELLEVGDSVPDLVLSPIVNFKKQSAKISDFNNQLLILDFWATWCVPCIRPFPKLDRLQHSFQGRVQFMLVTDEKKHLIESFFARLKKRNDYILPSVVEGKPLFEFFTNDNAFSRAYIWIMNGKVIAQTSHITEEDIRLVLAGKSIDKGRVAKDRVLEKLPNNFSQPLLSRQFHEGTNHIKYYSGFTNFIQGLKPYPYIKKPKPDDKTSGIRLVNLPLSYLYLEAHQLFPIYKVSLEMTDLENFDPTDSKKDSSNLYCYELVVNDPNLKDLHKIMQEDLKRVFGYKVFQNIREVNVAVLKRTKREDLSTVGEDPKSESTNFFVTIKNRPFAELVKTLEYYLVDSEIRFFIDETGIKKNIDITLDVNMSDPSAVATELKQYGLDLTVEKRPMKMYVIKDGE